MKGNDVLLLGKLLLFNSKWTYQSMGDMLSLSPSRIFDSTKVLIEAKLLFESYNLETNEALLKPSKKNALEFLFHGFKYIFPMVQKIECRGVPAFVSANIISENFQDSNKGYVWPYALANNSGIAITPFHKNVPEIALKDKSMYLFCACLDCIRGSNAREKEVGEKTLANLLEEKLQNE